jgi:UDP-N-acetylglucosamine acyltransferase
MSLIHPSAIIEDGANVDPSVRIGPFSIVEAGAVIGAGCVIESNVRIYGHTRMGRDNLVCHGATIGATPQDLIFTPDKAKPLVIGDGNRFRECANVSHGVKEDQGTVIGSRNYLMAFSHVGHDCVLGDHNILGNAATLGGHVKMGNRIFLSGLVGVHQFCRIGDYVMVGGVSGVRQDVPPYAMANGQYARFVGLNLVGLRRNGFSQGQRSAIKQAYRILMQSRLALPAALERLRQEADSEEVRAVVAFAEASKRGLISVE